MGQSSDNFSIMGENVFQASSLKNFFPNFDISWIFQEFYPD